MKVQTVTCGSQTPASVDTSDRGAAAELKRLCVKLTFFSTVPCRPHVPPAALLENTREDSACCTQTCTTTAQRKSEALWESCSQTLQDRNDVIGQWISRHTKMSFLLLGFVQIWLYSCKLWLHNPKHVSSLSIYRISGDVVHHVPLSELQTSVLPAILSEKKVMSLFASPQTPFAFQSGS